MIGPPEETSGQVISSIVRRATTLRESCVLVGIGGTLLTAFGAGFSQVRHLDPVASTYTQAAVVALSGVVGLGGDVAHQSIAESACGRFAAPRMAGSSLNHNFARSATTGTGRTISEDV